MQQSLVFKQTFQFDFPVTIQSFLIYFVEKNLRTLQESQDLNGPLDRVKIILRTAASNEPQVLTFDCGFSFEQRSSFFKNFTQRAADLDLWRPIYGFDFLVLRSLPQVQAVSEPHECQVA